MGNPLTKEQAEKWTNGWLTVADDINTLIGQLPENALQHYEPVLKRIDGELDDFKDMLEDLRSDYALDQ